MSPLTLFVTYGGRGIVRRDSCLWKEYLVMAGGDEMTMKAVWGLVKKTQVREGVLRMSWGSASL